MSLPKLFSFTGTPSLNGASLASTLSLWKSQINYSFVSPKLTPMSISSWIWGAGVHEEYKTTMQQKNFESLGLETAEA